MRKFMVIPLVGLLALAVAGPVAAAPNTSNTSGGGKTIYGEWSGTNSWGYVFFGEETGYGGFGDIYSETGEWVLCPAESGQPGNGKAKGAVDTYDTTTGDETYGFVGTRTWGYANDVQIDFTRRLASGSATGTAELYTETVDECAGDFGGNPTVETGAITINVTGVGSLATFRGHGTYKTPSEFNGHENYRGSERAASGSVNGPGSAVDETFDFAYMSQVTWTVHTNS